MAEGTLFTVAETEKYLLGDNPNRVYTFGKPRIFGQYDVATSEFQPVVGLQEKANPDAVGYEIGKNHSISVWEDCPINGHSYAFCYTKIRFRGAVDHTCFVAPVADLKMTPDGYLRLGQDDKRTYIRDMKQFEVGPFSIIPISGNFKGHEQFISTIQALKATDTDFSQGHCTIVRHFGDKVTIGQGMVRTEGPYIFYQMETFPGNCGSPIISACNVSPGCVIGIHAYGGSKQHIVENSGFRFEPKIVAAIRGVLTSKILN